MVLELTQLELEELDLAFLSVLLSLQLVYLPRHGHEGSLHTGDLVHHHHGFILILGLSETLGFFREVAGSRGGLSSRVEATHFPQWLLLSAENHVLVRLVRLALPFQVSLLSLLPLFGLIVSFLQLDVFGEFFLLLLMLSVHGLGHLLRDIRMAHQLIKGTHVLLEDILNSRKLITIWGSGLRELLKEADVS